MDKLTGGQIEIGPQYPKDDPFTARMRFHQSWYRARVLKAPFGVGPNSGNATRYGNMLTRADGERGLNFLTPHIFEIAKRRLAHKKATLEPFRLLHNMLSSQSMGFNLFGPLVDDVDLAIRFLSGLLPDEVKRISSVSLDYAPEPAKDYLNDRTCFDVFISYLDADGKQRFIGIKTRLAEPVSTKTFNSPFYNRWLDHPLAPWPMAAQPQLQTTQINQLWREHLLAVAMQLLPGSPYVSGRFMLVYHPLDAEFITAAAAYQSLLKIDDASFIAMPLDRLVGLLKDAVNTPASRQWMDAFARRYLDVGASDNEFEKL